MSSLLKQLSLIKKPYNYLNYKKIKINVITIFFLIILSSCEATEKAEKKRQADAFQTVSLIPPTEEDSEFFQTEYKQNPAPSYPW